ncbi:hypothetical protein PCK1_002877, partial [Pneumocystis canis]
NGNKLKNELQLDNLFLKKQNTQKNLIKKNSKEKNKNYNDLPRKPSLRLLGLSTESKFQKEELQKKEIHQKTYTNTWKYKINNLMIGKMEKMIKNVASHISDLYRSRYHSPKTKNAIA